MSVSITEASDCVRAELQCARGVDRSVNQDRFGGPIPNFETGELSPERRERLRRRTIKPRHKLTPASEPDGGRAQASAQRA
jgi:hypothetical protein